ncbi:MAG: hypothetical protein MJ159_03770 [Treponemataceae bacterium]|nr:hypothetical protein [Treponemataceae bacterium]
MEFFIDLSEILNIKIETVGDIVDNYEKLYELVRLIAQKQYFESEYKSSICILSVYNYPYNLWNGVQEEDFKYSKLYDVSYGTDWVEKVNNDLPKIRKSLGLE